MTPRADIPHAASLTDVMMRLLTANLHRGETRVVQAIGIWLPTGEEDYAIPDLAIVDADHQDHVVQYNCVEPAVCRLALEVTSSNWRTDLYTKPDLYAVAGPCT
ncbi:Uma2 family endonuclease [Streptomyces sp. RPT161]|uniref:Uma2 family endonuclease n=1 Tax=Streptomyces sp. RPT161 TaxID=3015993 RepID=UPI0022B8D231|nr:Uma2 family endonuclease [Streptomyces sp. RPT161]